MKSNEKSMARKRYGVNLEDIEDITNLIGAGYFAKEISEKFFPQYTTNQIAWIMAKTPMEKKPWVPDELREVVIILFYDGGSAEEVASICGISKKQVESIYKNEQKGTYSNSGFSNKSKDGKKATITGMQYYKLLREGKSREDIIDETGLDLNIARAYDAHLKMGTYQKKLEGILGKRPDQVLCVENGVVKSVDSD